jgi:hypothetical protein
MTVVLADFEKFVEHIHGRCDPHECERCKDPEEKLKRGVAEGL